MHIMSERFSESYLSDIARKSAALGIAVGSIVSCGNNIQTTDTLPFTEVISTINTDNTIEVVPADSARPHTKFDSFASANSPAVRVDPPARYDCSDATLLIFGNSVPAVTESVPNPWPTKLEKALNFRPDINGLQVTNVASPASNIISPSLYDSGSMSRLVTAIPYVLKNYTTEQKADMTVILDPSLGEISNIAPDDTDETVAARALYGIQTANDITHKYGVEHVIVLPMGSVAPLAEELQKFPINRRITMVNKLLQKLGITPKTMPVSPLTDPTTGKGNWKFFKNFVNKGPIMTGTADGVHPDNSGHEVYAQAIANLPELQADLRATCKAK